MKHNDKVTCSIGGIVITDARISINENGTPFICHNEEKYDGAMADDMLGYKYSWRVSKDFTDKSVTNLRLATGFKKGDIFVNTDDNKRKVLEILGDLYFMSDPDDFTSVGSAFTEQNLKAVGYKLVTPVKEYSHAEIAKALGIDAKDLKIKE